MPTIKKRPATTAVPFPRAITPGVRAGASWYQAYRDKEELKPLQK